MKLDSKPKCFYVGYNLPVTQADDLLVLHDPSKAYVIMQLQLRYTTI